jgi:hypothetical protein
MLKDLCNLMRMLKILSSLNAIEMHQMRPIEKFWTLFWKINKNNLKTHKIFNGSKSFYQISLNNCLKESFFSIILFL